MKLLQIINISLFVGSLLAVIIGLSSAKVSINDISLSIWLFISFYILLRIKTFLDDHGYFATADIKHNHVKIGFIIGMFSWLAWCYSGYIVMTQQDAFFSLGVTLGISTLWIIVDAIRFGAYKEQYYWLATNMIYIIILWSAYKLFSAESPSSTWGVWAALAIGIVVVVIDYVASKSFKYVE